MGCFVLVPALAAAGEDGGIVDTNYGVGLDYLKSRHTDTTGVSGSLNLPVYADVGSNLFAGGSKTNGHDGYVNDDSYSFGGTAFLRDFEVGKIGILGAYYQTKLDLPSNADVMNDELEANQYSLSGEYYLGNLTLGADRTVLDVKDGDNYNSWSGFAFVYLGENTRFSIDGSGMDAKDSFGLGVSHQPGFLNNSTEVSFVYNGARHDDTFSLSIDYYFGTRVSLVNRDRMYR